MEMEIVVNRIARDMRMQGLICEDCTEDVKFHLRLLWVASWESRGKILSDTLSRPVYQLTREGKLITEYHNVQIAARKAKYSRGTIYNSLHSGRATKRGHIWKYVER
jgi:hypothetical protein